MTFAAGPEPQVGISVLWKRGWALPGLKIVLMPMGGGVGGGWTQQQVNVLLMSLE